MSIWRNTTFTEAQPGSPNERWGAGATSVSMTLLLQDSTFQGRAQAARDFLGYSVLNPGGWIDRVTPMPFPGQAEYFPPETEPDILPPSGINQFWAMAISRTDHRSVSLGIDESQSPTGVPASSYVRSAITVEFSSLPYFVKDDYSLGYTYNGGPDEGGAIAAGWVNSRYIIRQIKPFSRLIKVPYGMMWNVGGPRGWVGMAPALPKNTKTALPIREGGANVSYTWMRVPLLPSPGGINWSLISAAQGSINDDYFDFAAPYTLLLDNIETREYQGAFGERYADVVYNMIYLPHHSTGLNFSPLGSKQGAMAGTPLGWNYIFDIVNGVPDYYFVTSDKGGANAPFRATDFPSLFRPKAPVVLKGQ